MGTPGRLAYRGGLKSRRDAQRRRQESPVRGLRVEDDEPLLSTLQVIAHGQTSLAAADHHDGNPLGLGESGRDDGHVAAPWSFSRR
jgi:hypothetical protein